MVIKHVRKHTTRLTSHAKAQAIKARERTIANATKAKNKALEFKREIRKSIVTAIVAAFGFVVALFWRDAIKDLMAKVMTDLGIQETAYLYSLIAAVIATLIAVIGIAIVSKMAVNEEKK